MFRSSARRPRRCLQEALWLPFFGRGASLAREWAAGRVFSESKGAFSFRQGQGYALHHPPNAYVETGSNESVRRQRKIDACENCS